MKKRGVKRAIATGIIIAELAVLDYAALMLVRNGVTIEVTTDELKAAEEAFEADLAKE